MAYEIRPATPEDVEAAEYVRVMTWKDAYRGIMPDAFLDDLQVDDEEVARRRGWLVAALDQGRTSTYVGLVDGRIVGFVNVGRSLDPGIEGGKIYAIYVLPEAQGNGLGQGLMQAAVDRLRADGHSEIGLWVATDNARSRQFYERFGLQPSGRVIMDEDLAVEETHYRMSV